MSSSEDDIVQKHCNLTSSHPSPLSPKYQQGPQETVSCIIPRRVASSNNVVSTLLDCIRTYRTTEPRMKQFFTAI